MSGYKRVNFYELCRLCASNQQKEKTHIFQEEGRKIQLQNKIQICLSLKVCENDFLPKVVCSQCLRTLEECYTFRNECVTSETMLSSYFNNFRYTEDFKKSGKVYIKDTTTTKTQQKDLTQKQSAQFEFITIPNGNNISTNNPDESDVYMASQPDKGMKPDGKPLTAYNLSTINFAALKGIVQNIPKTDQNNIAVSSNGEIINITPLIDLESILVQSQLNQKPHVTKPAPCKGAKRVKLDKSEGDDLRRHGDKYEKLPHIKSTPQNKFAYAIKIEESNKNGGGGSAVVVNQLSNVNVPINSAHNNFNQNYNSVQIAGNQTSNVATNWNFTPTNSGLNLINNGGNLIGANAQTMFNHTSNWNLVTTTTTANLAPNATPTTMGTAVGVTSNIIEQNEKIIQQGIQQLPHHQDNKQNILNGTRNNDIQTVDMSSIKNEAPIKTFPCELCPKVFKRREHLYQHVKLHTGFRPFGCENCKKSFMRKEHLMRHLTSHTGQKNFTCNICEKSFSRNDNLLKHKKTHEKQTSFTCEICQKQFVMKHYYLAHKMSHESSEKCQFWNILKT